MIEPKFRQILAISGSLRAVSSNTALLRAAIALAPKEATLILYEGLGNLPHFNPDLEGTELPAVLNWQTQLQTCDGVIISTPEYAHGVPGVLKNALDWVVGSGELVGKPIALLNASPRSIHAQASLRETLITMDARLIAEASITVPLPTNRIDESGIMSDPELSIPLRKAIDVFIEALG